MPLGYNVSNLNIVEVRLMQSLDGQRIINTLHYQAEFTSGPVDAQVVFDALQVYMQSSVGTASLLKGVQTPEISQDRNEYQLITPIRYSVYTQPGAGVGTEEDYGGAAPPNVAAVIVRRGLLSKRGGTSNLHIAGLGVGGIAGGRWLPQYRNQLTVLASSMVLEVNVSPGNKMFPCIFNRVDPLASQDVKTYAVMDTTRTMRRRTVGLGI